MQLGGFSTVSRGCKWRFFESLHRVQMEASDDKSQPSEHSRRSDANELTAKMKCLTCFSTGLSSSKLPPCLHSPSCASSSSCACVSASSSSQTWPRHRTLTPTQSHHCRYSPSRCRSCSLHLHVRMTTTRYILLWTCTFLNSIKTFFFFLWLAHHSMLATRL